MQNSLVDTLKCVYAVRDSNRQQLLNEASQTRVIADATHWARCSGDLTSILSTYHALESVKDSDKCYPVLLQLTLITNRPVKS